MDSKLERAKITVTDDGEVIKDPKWCVVAFAQDTIRSLCTGDALDGMSNAEYVVEDASKKGSITCPDCIDILKHYKSFKL